MVDYKKLLLTAAYDDYLKTGIGHSELLIRNGEMFIHCINAATSLVEGHYIHMLSDNLDLRTYDLLSPDDMILIYKLTQSGIEYCQNNF